MGNDEQPISFARKALEILDCGSREKNLEDKLALPWMKPCDFAARANIEAMLIAFVPNLSPHMAESMGARALATFEMALALRGAR